jgi:hypothetical protein
MKESSPQSACLQSPDLALKARLCVPASPIKQLRIGWRYGRFDRRFAGTALRGRLTGFAIDATFVYL